MSALITVKFLVDATETGDAMNVISDLLLHEQRTRMPGSFLIDYVFVSGESDNTPIPEDYKEGDWL